MPGYRSYLGRTVRLDEDDIFKVKMDKSIYGKRVLILEESSEQNKSNLSSLDFELSEADRNDLLDFLQEKTGDKIGISMPQSGGVYDTTVLFLGINLKDPEYAFIRLKDGSKQKISIDTLLKAVFLHKKRREHNSSSDFRKFSGPGEMMGEEMFDVSWLFDNSWIFDSPLSSS